VFKHPSDELYQNSLILPGSEVLATAYSDPAKDPKNTGKDEPVGWGATYGTGRGGNIVLGHDVDARRGGGVKTRRTRTGRGGAGFKTLMTRAVEWAATGEVSSPVPDELKGEK